jgi:hypothetical protein
MAPESASGDQTQDDGAYTNVRDNWRGIITLLSMVTALNDENNLSILKPAVSSQPHHLPLQSNENLFQLVLRAITRLAERDFEVMAVSTQLQGLSLSALTTGGSYDTHKDLVGSESDSFLEYCSTAYQTDMGTTSTGGITGMGNPDRKDKHLVGENTFAKLLPPGTPHFDELVESGDSYFDRK